MRVGVLVLSFAKREDRLEPNPVNIALAEVADEIIIRLLENGDEPIVVAQYETDRAMLFRPAYVVTPDDASLKPNGTYYLDSADVIRLGSAEFKSRGARYVVVVANPWIHLPICRALVKKQGFWIVRQYKIPPVGFDNSEYNLQWWFKGPIRLLAYTGLQVIGKLIGRNLHGIGERQSAHS